MPKKHSKDELKTYFQKLATQSGLPAEKAQAVLDALDHDGFASVVDTEGVLLRGEFSRVLNDEVAPLKSRYETEYNRLVNEWYPGVKRAHDDAVAAKSAADNRVKSYESRYGSIDETEDLGGGRVRTET